MSENLTKKHIEQTEKLRAMKFLNDQDKLDASVYKYMASAKVGI